MKPGLQYFSSSPNEKWIHFLFCTLFGGFLSTEGIFWIFKDNNDQWIISITFLPSTYLSCWELCSLTTNKSNVNNWSDFISVCWQGVTLSTEEQSLPLSQMQESWFFSSFVIWCGSAVYKGPIQKGQEFSACLHRAWQQRNWQLWADFGTANNVLCFWGSLAQVSGGWFFSLHLQDLASWYP